MTDAELIRRWLPYPRSPGAIRLYCLPHAGGSASAFRTWIAGLPRIAVSPLQLPGRETRLSHQPHHDMAPLASELADIVLATADENYAVYGHSLGALVGFEVLREIRRRGGPMPMHLLVSGSAAPQCPSDGWPIVREMNDDGVVHMLRRLGGTPESLLSDPGLLQMILPAVRADFSVKDSYRYQPEAPLDLPITVLAADRDPRAGSEQMAQWREQTTGQFELHTVGEGHFAVYEQVQVTQKYIAAALHRGADRMVTPQARLDAGTT